METEVEVMGSEQLEVKKDINPLFAAFSEEEFGAIVDKLEPMQFMSGERMIAEGDEGDAMYLISRGGGRVVKEIDGQEVVLDELGEGEFFRSEEHTSELQSRPHLVCRLLLAKKNNK